MRKALHERRDYLYQALNEIEGITCVKPDGAFYAFPNISSILKKSYKGKKIDTAFHLAELLLNESHIAVVPGEGFGAPEYIRLSYSISMDKLKQGIERLKTFITSCS